MTNNCFISQINSILRGFNVFTCQLLSSDFRKRANPTDSQSHRNFFFVPFICQRCDKSNKKYAHVWRRDNSLLIDCRCMMHSRCTYIASRKEPRTHGSYSANNDLIPRGLLMYSTLNRFCKHRVIKLIPIHFVHAVHIDNCRSSSKARMTLRMTLHVARRHF